MKTIVIFEKYELSENGEIKNINTGNLLKTEETANGKFANLYIDGKTKRTNITKLIEESFSQIEEEKKIEEQTEEKIEEKNETIDENQNQEQKEEEKNEEKTEETQPQNLKPQRSSKKYIVRVTELNGTVNEFDTFKKANDHYGLRKDYLNYCIAEKFSHMLTKGDLQLKSVEKISK